MRDEYIVTETLGIGWITIAAVFRNGKQGQKKTLCDQVDFNDPAYIFFMVLINSI